MACRRSVVAPLALALLSELQPSALGKENNSTSVRSSLRGSVECRSKGALCGSHGQRTAVCCRDLSCEPLLGSFEMRCAESRQPPKRSQCSEIGCGSQGKPGDTCECIEECLLRGTCCSDFASLCKRSPTVPPTPSPTVLPTPAPAPAPGPQPMQTYDHYHDKNAFAPYGAIDIDSDSTAPTGLTPQQCEERCTADVNCMCVTQERSTGKCWKRADCDPSMWTSQYNTGYNVYMKQGRVPRGAGWLRLELFTSFLSNQQKCLDVKNHQTYNGNMVQLWDCIYDDNDQYWNPGNADAVINSQLMWATHPEKCLDVKDHQTSNGTPLQIWDCIASDFDQKFYLDTSVPPAGHPTFGLPRPVGRLRWKDHPSKCVVANDGGDWNGNGIVLTDCVDGQDSQYWVNSYVER